MRDQTNHGVKCDRAGPRCPFIIIFGDSRLHDLTVDLDEPDSRAEDTDTCICGGATRAQSLQ
jgi:hypothetical protein